MNEIKSQLEVKTREVTKANDEKDQIEQKLKHSEEEITELKG